MDTISRIILQSSGGDQAAQEIGKVTKAYGEAAKAKRGMEGGISVGEDAFSRAAGGSPDLGAHEAGAERLRRGAKDREEQHRTITGSSQMGAGVSRAGPSLVGSLGEIASGNPIGGAGAAAGQVAGMIGGTAGTIALMGVAAGVAAGKMVQLEWTRSKELWGSGTLQRLGVPQSEWDVANSQFWVQQRNIQKQGLGSFNSPFIGGLQAGGGTYNYLQSINALQYAANTGVSADVLGNFTGRAMQAGGLGNLWRGGGSADWLQRQSNVWGAGGQNQFLTSLTSTLERAMSQGFEKGSSALNVNFMSRILSGYTTFGGMTALGAQSASSALMAGNAAMGAMSKPSDIMFYRALKKPGESIIETQARMASSATLLDKYKVLKEKAGGDRSALELMVQQAFGLPAEMVQGTIANLEGQLSIETNAAKKALTAGTGTGTGIPEFSNRQLQAAAQGKLGTAFQDIQATLGAGAAKALVPNLSFGGSEGFYQGSTFTKFATSARKGDYSELLKLLPPDLQTAMAGAIGKLSETGQQLPLVGLLENLSAYHMGSSGKLSAQEQAVFNPNAGAFKALAQAFESKQGVDILNKNPEALARALSQIPTSSGPQGQMWVDVLAELKAIKDNTKLNLVWSDANAGKK